MMLEMWGNLLSLGFVFLSVRAENVEKNSSDDHSLPNYFHENKLEEWEAPLEFQKEFSYIWSGFDEECRPSELGQWDVRKYVLKGEHSRGNLTKYIHQGIHRGLQSLNYNNSDCETKPTQIVGILDVENFQYSQAASTQTVQFILEIAKDHIDLMIKHVHKVYFVNTNFFANGILLLARPILGEFMERVEVYGTRKSLWLPKLLKKLPWDQLPGKFGGNKNFQPVKIYG